VPHRGFDTFGGDPLRADIAIDEKPGSVR
jgi:hypothetical protein